MTPLQQLVCLEAYARRSDVCFHGSSALIDGAIQPHQATCNSGKPENNQFAVYAEPGDFRIPCFKAMHVGGDSEYCVRNGEMVAKTKLGNFSPAYVYILPKATFVQLGNAFLSYSPVMPIDQIVVTPFLFPLFKNFVIKPMA